MATPQALNPAARYLFNSKILLGLGGAAGVKLPFNRTTDLQYGGTVLVVEPLRIARFVPVRVGPSARVLSVFADARWKFPTPPPPPPPVPL